MRTLLVILVLVMVNAACSEDPTRPGSDAATPDAYITSDALPGQEGYIQPPDQGPTPDNGVPTPDNGVPTPDKGVPQPDQGVPLTNPCPKLPAPSGTVVNVKYTQAGQLSNIVYQAKSGTTILLEDGTYTGIGTLHFHVPKVTLRSASGDRDKVTLDGGYKSLEIVFIEADDITIADLTLKKAEDHLIHVTGGGTKTTKNARLYNLKLIDSGEQFVKVNAAKDKPHYADDGELECSHLEMTAAGRPNVETNPGGCYTGGIDTHSGWGWKVRYNTFKGIYCDNGSLAEHAVHFWSASRDTLVERNTIVDCARGIGFGLNQTGKDRTYPDNPYPSVGYMGHIDGIIRNNVIHASPSMAKYFDTGIDLAQAHGSKAYHNTVVSQPTFSSIDYRFPNTKAEIRNNLTYKITKRDGAQGTVDHNLQSASAALFVDAAKVNYKLKATASQAIDKGVVVSEAGLDMEGKPHNVGTPDLGAYEHKP